MRAHVLVLTLAACGSSPAPGGATQEPTPPAAPPTSGADVLETSAGRVEIHPVQHGTVRFTVGDKVVWVDPWSKADLSGPKADLVLITDIHPDHYDEAGLAAVRKDDALVVAPPVVAEKVAGAVALANGESRDLGFVRVEAIPMYNLKRGPEEGKLFHDKGRGNGYVLTIGDRRIYLSGDTECTPEMKALRDIDVAFVCMNLPYTMTPAEAAECVAAFKPKVLYPYHYRDSNLDELDSALAGSGVEVRRRDWY
ncbi:MBL fold metallo-hydrolase [Nannocystis radixulma]|uniref:MBL fold metallo-hydrolase n=1 Tax=Nannocystis radixulma TaxID=2995305 RepID=A0ABT5B1S4_9BACT|nr:MBL fold metallo-hydrolase [Nannocystis radixulma]MDC0668064.1 MBL fold metallo-hydrolase [Nannocystis radixulma]